MGRKTYDEARKEWVDASLYSNQSPTTSSMATSGYVNTTARDRVRDLYCVLHFRDSSGKFTNTDLGMRKITDVVVSFEIINYMIDLFCIFCL